MIWQWSHRFDPRSLPLADRHYNRRKPGSPQFVPPGRCCCLYAEVPAGRAFWVTSWPFGEYVRHAWPGAWVCSAFRNEGAGRASDLIADALSCTRDAFGDGALGMVTFVDRSKVQPTVVRGAKVWGWTYRKAGFREAGETKGGLLALYIATADMPASRRALMPLEAATA